MAPAAPTPITFANVPNLQLTIPAGVTITGWDGQPNTQIGARQVPLDRLAIPPPPASVKTNAVYMFNFGKVGGGLPSSPVPAVFPNTTPAPPGAQVEMWFFNEAPDGTAPNAWQLYGLGTVSSDGQRVVANPGVGIPRFCCGGGFMFFRDPIPPPPNASEPGEGVEDPCPCDASNGEGDPVEPATGIFLHRRTDLVLRGRIPAVLTRIYRTNDPILGPFGIGTQTSYDAFVRVKSSDLVLLFLPGNYKSRWVRQPDGSYAVTDRPGLRGARLTRNPDLTWTLRFKDGRAWTFSAAGWLTAQRDRNTNTLAIVRDGQNRISAIREPAGRELTLSYSGADLKIAQVTDPLGRTVSYSYDGSNRLIQVTNPEGGTWRYTYDSANRMLAVTDPRGNVMVQNSYDANGRVATQTFPDGGVLRFAYTIVATTVTGTQVTDPMGNTRRYRFDGQGYALERTDGLGGVATIVLQAPTNLVTSTTDPLARTTQFTYDAQGNVTTITDALGQVTQFSYEPTFNQVTSVTDPLGQTTTFAYDPATGNLLQRTDPLGHATGFTYTPQGDLLTATDALGNTTTFAYDSTGNRTATVDPLGNRTEFGYDGVSRLVSGKDPRGAMTQFTYDAMDRILSSIDPLGQTVGFTYDANGNLVALTDPRGSVTAYAYDARNRVTTRTDPLGRAETSSYDLNGNRRTFTDRKGQTTTYTYDAQDRRIRSGFVDGTFVTFTYDPAGRLSAATDSQTGTIANAYDPLDRLTAQVTPQGAITYAYDPLDRRLGMQVNGLPPVTYLYDAASRLTQVQQGIQTAALAYDAADRRTLLTLPNGVTTTYDYDAASRLTAQIYTGPGGVLGALTYAYDPAGNRIATGGSWARTGLPPAVPSATYDAANQQLALGTKTMTYDANGNLTTLTEGDSTTTYTWNAGDQLTGISGTAPASFAHDAMGRRIQKTMMGFSASFQYDGQDIVREIAGTSEAFYLRGLRIDEPFSRTEAGDTMCYLADPLGSIVALTDGTGGVRTSYTYDPFGRSSTSGESSQSGFQFTGRENDSNGLYYYRARYLDPLLGRFIQEDPIGFAGGATNLYMFVLNNALKYIDPLGLAWEDWQDVIGTLEGTTKENPKNKAKTPYGFDTDKDEFVALPDEGLRGRRVELEVEGKKYIVPVGDIGPWNGGHTRSGRSLNDPLGLCT